MTGIVGTSFDVCSSTGSSTRLPAHSDLAPSTVARSTVAHSTGMRFSAERLADMVGQPGPTPEQRAVIEAPLGAAVVIAGAGSGKTETMASRVVWLVANRHVEPDAVLGLTFTRKAAAELGARIRRRLHAFAAHTDPEQQVALRLSEPTVLTYAAYCGRLVVDHGLRLGLEPATRLLSPAAVWQIADRVVRRYGGPLDDDIGTPGSIVGYVLQLAGELSDHLSDVGTVERFTDDLLRAIEALPSGKNVRAPYPGELNKLVTSARHRRQLLPLVEQFAQEKRRLGAADFADQLVWAARLAEVADVQEMERQRYRAVLLDEYQDTGHAQIELLRRLFGAGHPVTAVGDPFQSIYGWRGASSGNIARFPMDFGAAGTAPFTLSTSWRNDRAVLAVANTVAAPLRKVSRGTVELQARQNSAPGRVLGAFTETVEDEAGWVAAQMKAAWDAMTEPRTAAVLVRRRSQMPLLADALRAEGLPVEVVGLGGLLTTPEVADVIATLHVLADVDSGAALLRLLTGARWRIGPRDLAALARRARNLAARPLDAAPVNAVLGPANSALAESAAAAMAPGIPVGASGPANDGVTGGNPDDAARRADGDGGARERAARRRRDPGSIVEALDDLGPRAQYSELGYARMSALAVELARLRRRLSAPLPDLVAEIERTSGVDIEVSARSDKAAVGRAHLDRFLDAASDFSVDADQATLTAFLAYLKAAEDEENGLAQAEVDVEADRVQLLTVHGAKGLEWNAVAVPGLGNDIFPSAARTHDWTRSRQLLPFPLRGDVGDLPELRVAEAETRRELADLIEARDGGADLKSQLLQAHLREERRLAYVAYTRARSTLLLSGYAWDASKKPREPSDFLLEARALVDVYTWFEVAGNDAENPHDTRAAPFEWPYDPLGERRRAVADGAELVRAALARRQVVLGPPREEGKPAAAAQLEILKLSHAAATIPARAREASGSGAAAPAVDRDRWRRDVEILLAERAALQSGVVRTVALPATLSVSQLVRLKEDPDEFARRLARPQPNRPAPLARRGTAFHLWLERLWQGEHLLDIDELPGAADESADVEADLRVLQAAFHASSWAQRRPHEIEVPFEMVVAGVVVRGRMDAVFAEEAGEHRPTKEAGAEPVDGTAGEHRPTKEGGAEPVDSTAGEHRPTKEGGAEPVESTAGEHRPTKEAGAEPVKGTAGEHRLTKDGGAEPVDSAARNRLRWLVVDWKTGAVPQGAHARAAAVQLAAYRLAWQRIVSTEAAPVELDQVGAAFHYVADNVTVAPVDLLDADGLRALIAGDSATNPDLSPPL